MATNIEQKFKEGDWVESLIYEDEIDQYVCIINEKLAKIINSLYSEDETLFKKVEESEVKAHYEAMIVKHENSVTHHNNLLKEYKKRLNIMPFMVLPNIRSYITTIKKSSNSD
ncbi:MAG: hypothetical protein WC812_00445 [Candidatus Pacearchaeota archaeon]|jgi:hypothetical protein